MAKRVHESSDEESDEKPLNVKTEEKTTKKRKSENGATPKTTSQRQQKKTPTPPTSSAATKSSPATPMDIDKKKKTTTAAAKKKVKEESESPAPKTNNTTTKSNKKVTPKTESPAPKSNSKSIPKSTTKNKKSQSPAVTDGATTNGKSPKKEKSPKEENGKATANNDEDADEEEGDEDDEEKWWNMDVKDALGDGTQKWTTLEHNGVLFPPDYVQHNVKMLYDGKPVTLPLESEEIASHFGSMLNSDHAQNPTFQKNFFHDFQRVLQEHPPTSPKGIKIEEFEKCDFNPIFEHYQQEREKRKAMTREEKKAEKAKKDENDEPYRYCIMDGKKEKVGNFRVEPPSLFRGRGSHPKTGKIKYRVKPEQITINIGEDAKVPPPPEGHQWGKVIHDNTVAWLAMWKENINGNFKYVLLGAGSTIKGKSDFKKFEKARELKGHIDRIRRDYTEQLSAKEMVVRQRATAMYLIDQFALRAGNEKGEDEADTVGCCSLRYEHVTLEPPNKLVFDFLGKDSIRFFKEAEVTERVFKNMVIFKRNLEEGDTIFDRLTTTMLNKHLTSYMDGLSAKVFRTYNASYTFQKELEKTDPDASVANKLLQYNRANREVAVLCNHQRSVSKNHAATQERMLDKLRALKYERRIQRLALFTLDATLKKKHPELKEDESDIDDEWMNKHENDLLERNKQKAIKKFEKENEKAKQEDMPEMESSELDQRLEQVKEDHDRHVKERKSKKVITKRTPEKVLEAIERLDKRIEAQRIQTLDREEGKEISLGTSKINYIDPRITYAWCAKHDVPVEKIFNKSLREKFPWAAEVDPDWKF